jgi:hypothetical protein
MSSHAQRNQMIMQESNEKTKDEFLLPLKKGGDQIRATYASKIAEPDQYEEVPKEILKKTRLNDINVKRGQDGQIFKTDFRISSSIETQIVPL